jgi:hypothetical protein
MPTPGEEGCWLWRARQGQHLAEHCGIRSDLMEFTVDRNPHKHGMFLRPRTNVRSSALGVGLQRASNRCTSPPLQRPGLRKYR